MKKRSGCYQHPLRPNPERFPVIPMNHSTFAREGQGQNPSMQYKEDGKTIRRTVGEPRWHDFIGKGLSYAEFAVFLILDDFAGSKEYCWCLNPTIAKLLGVSKKSIERHIATLQEKGWIVVQTERKESKWLKPRRVIYVVPEHRRVEAMGIWRTKQSAKHTNTLRSEGAQTPSEVRVATSQNALRSEGDFPSEVRVNKMVNTLRSEGGRAQTPSEVRVPSELSRFEPSTQIPESSIYQHSGGGEHHARNGASQTPGVLRRRNTEEAYRELQNGDAEPKDWADVHEESPVRDGMPQLTNAAIAWSNARLNHETLRKDFRRLCQTYPGDWVCVAFREEGARGVGSPAQIVDRATSNLERWKADGRCDSARIGETQKALSQLYPQTLQNAI